ncbi:MAG: ATP-dependent helicase [Rhodoluna sp.]|nr:ATP-dependent helicase [Rhodoluna sp.]
MAKEFLAEDLLSNLDDEQRLAAESLVGPTCILAGAGTGKTRTITHRIAYGIAKGYYAANRVLALTYTNRAAGELRSRLRALGAAGVQVKTFHAAALSQLEFFWPQFAGVPAPQVLESKGKLIGQAATELGLKLDTAALRDVAAEIEWRKYSMLSIEQYAELVSKRPRVGSLTAEQNLALQEQYELSKVRSQRLDWEDVLILTLGMLRAEPLALSHVQQQYRFFTVDEYQDISPLQHELLDAWMGDHTDLCVVGDPNQTIYSFTGATSDFLRNFATRYEDAKVMQLTQNYRSTQKIVSAANRVVAESNPVDALTSQGEVGDEVRVLQFAHITDEAKEVALAVKEQLAAGVKPNEIAVLYRVNGQSEVFEAALADQKVDYQLRGGERFFNRPEIARAMTALRAESNSASREDKSTFELVTDVCRSLGWTAREPDAAGAERDRWESLSALIAMLAEMPEGSSLAQFAAELDERKRSQHEPVKPAVTLSTIHAAKGLEWSHVFIVGVTEGYLPIAYAGTAAEIAEEKRLFYVAITRAKRKLSISWSKRDNNSGREREPSRFLSLVA